MLSNTRVTTPSTEALAEMARQIRDLASFAGTASRTRLLETWADVLEGKPDVGWAPRNREDLRNEMETP